MSELSYRLAVLSHGPDGGMLVTRALAAFDDHVTPKPEAVTIHRDANPQLGFCGATAKLWQAMVECGNEYVFWLEHDFEIARDVDLTQVAACLKSYAPSGQMAFMRDAYSEEEKQAGGLYELGLKRGDWQPRRHIVYGDDLDQDDQMGPELAQYPWLEMPWWTSNPSLMRRDWMDANRLVDDGQPHCEGRFGIRMRNLGYTFGTWGSGEVYCNHVGVRTGTGY